MPAAPESRPTSEPVELRELFHRLSNQLGVILAHAELLVAKAPDDTNRARAAHVMNAALEAMTTAREIRHQIPSTPTEEVGA